MKRRIFLFIGLVCIVFSGYGIPPASVVYADDIIAASGSATDIQAAVDAVYAAGGGTVYIPEGDFELNGAPVIPSNVNLIGAGIDVTILRTQGEDMTIHAQGDNIRISSFSLISTNYDGGDGVYVRDCVDFRVDNLHIEGYWHAGVYSRGVNNRGVIDHCFIKVRTGGIADGYGYGVCTSRDDFWEDDMHLGTAEAVFIEDCEFVNARHAVAANSGAHYVARHNLVRESVRSHAFDAHGPGHGSTEGTRCVEIYDNVIEDPISSSNGIMIRGGGGVIFNNIIRGGYSCGVMLTIDSEQQGQPYPVYHQISDLYIWDIQHDAGHEIGIENNSVDYLEEGRDYFVEPMPGYTPYTYPHPLTLEGGNQPPVLDAIGDKSTDEEELLEFTISATDPNDDPLTYSASNLPSGASFDSGTRTFSWTPGIGQAGTYPDIGFTVSDNGSLTDSENITITVIANSPPVLDSIGDKSTNEGQLLEFTISATDPNDDPLTYSVSNLPSGASFDSGSHIFSWTPGTGQAGTYPDIWFTVSDDDSLTDSENITITVTIGIHTSPTISFIPPTDADDATVSRDWTEVNVSVNSTEDTSGFIDWDNSLAGYWDFNENSGSNAFDNSSYQNDGTLINGPQWIAGRFGPALDFDGTDGYVDLPDTPGGMTYTQGTIMAWIRAEVVPSEDYSLIYSNHGAGTWDDRIYLGIGNDQIFLRFGTSSETYVSSIQADTWYHLALTWSGGPSGDYTVYRDGVFIAGGSYSGLGSLGPYSTLGAIYRHDSIDYGGFFNGIIDEVRIWSRTLSEEEIRASYNTTLYSLNRTFTNLPDGTYQYYAYVTDTTGDSAQTETRTLTVNTASPNTSPGLDAIGDKSVNEGELLEFTISATDPDGDPLTYSASNLPEGASFDPDTQTFSWTPRYDQAGTYSVYFEVTDGELTDAEDINITVIQLYEDWDVNGDSAANVLDMTLVGQLWDEIGLTGWIREDTNEDGTVNMLDMIIIGQHWTG